jgi:two-component system cell cycle sensor histidine kinase/response regulator CckA
VFNAPGPGRGTIFSLFFPCAEAEKPALEAALPVASPVDACGMRILLVEDDRAVRIVLRRALERAGLVVTEAVDALAALPLVEDLNFAVDVLVSDVMMPGMDGPVLVARARAVRPALPVVLMSGYAEPPQREAAADPGTAFLAKPFSATALVAAIVASQRH